MALNSKITVNDLMINPGELERQLGLQSAGYCSPMDRVVKISLHVMISPNALLDTNSHTESGEVEEMISET